LRVGRRELRGRGRDLAIGRDALRRRVPEVILESSLAELAGTLTADAGWGFDADARVANALDTALALRALIGTRALPTNTLVKVIQRIALFQNLDGGFSQALG